MGYARYEIIRANGDRIEAGYAVQAICEKDGCNEQIDRGLAHLCGKDPRGDDHGCGGYFCANHLYGDNQCESCAAKADEVNRWVHPDTGEEFDLRDRFLPAGARYDSRSPVWKHQGEWRGEVPVLAHVLPQGERAVDTETRLLSEGEWEDVGRIVYRQMTQAS
ncbi:hypothetical protein OH540_09380 [Streptomyces sp. BPPL-273]|uniref:hypothetical protein n=1 Tax=Streptomyces sp. BPPL-273 TaxID=2987533 RepID=UPI0024AEE09A|nr:hypothetical protein [Streptomyces sp. BPPL-273]WHM30233.1 hypothetical protein OH540_09380 [Streptomyces sp. BPPL-273]